MEIVIENTNNTSLLESVNYEIIACPLEVTLSMG